SLSVPDTFSHVAAPDPRERLHEPDLRRAPPVRRRRIQRKSVLCRAVSSRLVAHIRVNQRLRITELWLPPAHYHSRLAALHRRGNLTQDFLSSAERFLSGTVITGEHRNLRASAAHIDKPDARIITRDLRSRPNLTQ